MKFRKAGGGRNRVRTALVLSGGGAKGAYQVGVMKELMDRGIFFDLVTGSSIGAFNGALFVEYINRGWSYKQITEMLEEVWQQVDNFLSPNWKGYLGNFLNPLWIPAIFSNEEIRKVLGKHIPGQRSFSDYTRCQLSVTGTNLDKKELRIFDFNSSVPVIDAVVASMAYPVAFPCVKIEDDSYIDGGTLDNAPLKEAILWGATRIYVVFLTPLSVIEGGEDDNGEEKRREYSIIEVIDSLIELISNNLMYGDLKRVDRVNYLIRLLKRYREQLPPAFLEEIRDLFGIKPVGEKRIVRITRISPNTVLRPPGAMGFDMSNVLSELIERGQLDTQNILEA